MIPYGRQIIDEEDVLAVIDVLRSDFLTQGPRVPAFEAEVADYVGASHAVAVNSATSALHIACMGLGLEAGDILWTSPITFVASANCARYCGADVDFVDIDPDTFNICIEALEKKLSAAASVNKLPKIIVAVHMGGQSPNMAQIKKLADSYQVKIIEDASHSIGADYMGVPVGGCKYSDVTVFSFHPVKIITTAEGGLATTNDAELADKMSRFRSHGITRDSSLMTHESDGPWYYQQLDLGYNYRMTEIQAALGLSQIKKLGSFVGRRRELAAQYDIALKGMALQIPGREEAAESSWHLYIIRLNNAKQHSSVFQDLRDAGIGVNLHYIPVHLQPYYRRLGFQEGDFPKAEDYYSRAISIPLHAGLSDGDQELVVRTLKSVL